MYSQSAGSIRILNQDHAVIQTDIPLETSSHDSPRPNHTSAGTKNITAVRTETQTPISATPKPILSYIPLPAELESQEPTQR